MAEITKPQAIKTASVLSPQSSVLSVQRLWAARGIWLGAGAWLVALAGLALLPAEPGRTWAMGVEALAGVLAVIAWGHLRLVRGLPTVARGTPVIRLDRVRLARLAGIAVAGGLVWVADQQWIAQPNEPFGLAGVLWLLSMALLIVATVGWPERKNETTDGSVPAGSSLSGRQEGAPVSAPDASVQSSLPVRRAGDALPVEASLPPPALAPPGKPGAWPMTIAPWTGWEIALFAGLIVLAFAVRVWDLQGYPFAIHGDEILTARNAIQYYVSGQPVSVFSTVWPPDINLPALWFFGVAIPLKVGGQWLAMVRLPAALFGAATVVPFYGLVREAWGRAAALGGTAILAVSASQVAISRISVNNIVTPFFWALCCWFLLRGLRRRRPIDWTLAGLAGGLGEYSFYGTRLLMFVLAAFLVYLLVVHWREGWRYLGHIGLGVLGYLAGFGPLLAYFLTNPGVYFGRGQAGLVWDHIPRDLADFQKMWETLWPRMALNLLAFSYQIDQDSFYWGTFLLVGETALLVLGTALLIRHWRRPAAFLILLVGGSVLFVGGTLVRGVPFFVHWTPGFPAVYAALAVPIGAWAASWRQPIPFPAVRWRVLGPALIAALLAISIVANINFYFNQYRIERAEFDLRGAQARFVGALGADYLIREVGWTWQPYDAEADSYFVHGQDGAVLLNPASQLPVIAPPGKGLAFLFFDDEQQFRAAVGDMYPGGKWGEVFSTNKTHLFYTYLLTPQQMAGFGGALLQAWDEGGTALRWSGPVTTVGQVPAAADGYPLRARWSGAFYLAAAGEYRLAVSGAPATLLLDGQAAALPVNQILVPGWHRFVVAAHLINPAPLRLLAASAGADLAEVPHERLWPEAPGAGLLGTVAGNSPPVLARVDPFIGFSAAGDPTQVGPGLGAQLPVRVRWTGQLLVPQAGTYGLEIRSGGNTRLLLDGAPIATTCAGNDPVTDGGPHDLTAGPHTLQLDYRGGSIQQYLELYWTPPGGDRQVVPPSALRYMAPTDSAPPPLPDLLTGNPCGGS